MWFVVCVGHSFNDVGGVVEVSNVVFLHSTVLSFFEANQFKMTMLTLVVSFFFLTLTRF